MNSITRHIEYLILRHDCVIVPELGAFIAQYSPARIDETTGVILPPSRLLSFNCEVSHNDGLLAASIARATSMTFDRASASIADQVAALKSQIDNGGEYAVGRLGILRGNQEGNLEFEPFTATAISPRLVGLPTFTLTPFEVSAKPEEAQKRGFISRTGKAALRAAASVAVLLGLGLMLSTPVIEHRSELATFGKSLTFSAKAPEKIVIENPRQVLSFACPDPANAVAAVAPKPQKEVKPLPQKQTQEVTDDSYFLIVASLPSRSKAEEYIAAHPGNNLNILASEDRYRIYAASGKSYNEVYSILSAGDNSVKYPDAWVFRR
ncbi:MAG: hypothetical protein NC248_03515 [Bacteroides sp.]|nr:hypothetical protein [Bacteroides sp.]MCM1389867.1 hypothetical protein [Bacteroides sp.]